MKSTDKSADKSTVIPHRYQVEFSTCTGMYISGKQSHVLRTIPYTGNDKHRMFHTVYYMPVQTPYIETYEINLKVFNIDDKYISNGLSEISLMTCVLHFKRCKN